MDLQKLVDAMSEADRRTRSNYHVTLGHVIEAAKAATGFVRFADVGGPGVERSYRGYYSDLAFEHGDPEPVAAFLARMSAALGDTYQGYKGGDYVMTADTPLWRAPYGHVGEAIVDAEIVRGDLVLRCKAVD